MNPETLLFILATVSVSCAGEQHNPCAKKNINGQSFVCVCNATYCDNVESSNPATPGLVQIWETSASGNSLTRREVKAESKQDSKGAEIHVDVSKTGVEIIGFGGAFTDAAGINIASLKDSVLRDQVIDSYFGQDGLRYTLGRVPMASCDFSTRVYSYDDVAGDFALTNFSLAAEDHKYKIPFIKQAMQASNNRLKLFGSPWSPPGWMKDSGKMYGRGGILGSPGGRHYRTWAQYFLRFLESYKQEGLDFWGLTVQNEPMTGYIPKYSFQTNALRPGLERDFVKKDLGPALNGSRFRNVKIIIGDTQRPTAILYARTVMKDAEAARYVSGLGVHWYGDWFTPAYALKVSQKYMGSDRFMLATEACHIPSTSGKPKGPLLGSWYRAALYGKYILQDLNNGVAGWTDWNLALDLQGGPNWVENYVDAPVIVNATAQEFYKQPMFYVLGHFSRFITPGAKYVAISTKRMPSSISTAAFLTPNKDTLLIIQNRSGKNFNATIHDNRFTDKQTSFTIHQNSIVTVQYTAL